MDNKEYNEKIKKLWIKQRTNDSWLLTVTEKEYDYWLQYWPEKDHKIQLPINIVKEINDKESYISSFFFITTKKRRILIDFKRIFSI